MLSHMKTLVTSYLLSVAALFAGAGEIYLGSRPSVAPDGSWFVFEWADNVWKASTAGGDAQPMFSGTASYRWPILSPDASRLVFMSDSDGGERVFEQDLEKGTIRQVSYHSESTFPYAYTPDGKKLIGCVYRDSVSLDGSSRVALLDVEKRAPEQLLFDVEAGEPALSPDGGKVLFTRGSSRVYRKRMKGSGVSQIWLYDLRSRVFTPVVKRDTGARSPLWKADGKGFYYTSEQDGAFNLWERDLASGGERQLTFFKDDSVMQPSLSRDGKTIVFRHLFDFYRIHPSDADSKPEKIALRPVAYTPRPPARRRYYASLWNNDEAGDATFAENGLVVAFTAGGDLYVMDSVLREPRLVQGASLTHERECCFAPDGKTLYYFSDRGDGTDLWKAERSDEAKMWWENFAFKKTRLTWDDTQKRNLQISSDGKHLSWVTGYTDFTIADREGKTLQTTHATACYGYSWSGDGRWVALAKDDEYHNTDIWIVSAENKREPYNVSRHFRWDGCPAWSPDGKILAFCGDRPDSTEQNLFYVWMDPAEEEAAGRIAKESKARETVLKERAKENEKKKEEKGKKPKECPPVKIVFEGLHERVRRLTVYGNKPFFHHDSRTLYFQGKTGTFKVKIPDTLQPSLFTKTKGDFRSWFPKGDRLCWIVDSQPAHKDTLLKFNVYQNTDVADYQELGFLTAWGCIRDRYYDPACHGVDWNAVREKYLQYARNAPSYTVFQRIIQMMLGELNSSHLGFKSSTTSKKEWQRKESFQSWSVSTAHLGLRFDPAYVGKGWKIKEVLKGGPAEKFANELHPGDLLVSLDGRELDSSMDPTEVLNAPLKKVFRAGVKTGKGDTHEFTIVSQSFEAARVQAREALCRRMRETVHERSQNRFGYLNIEEMKRPFYYRFEEEVFSEGYGRDGLIIDVRGNPGGNIADALLNILCRKFHCYKVARDGKAAYSAWLWKEPVWTKPVVVLCNNQSGSNSEIFSHAIKTFKRGKLVGETTGGNVITTREMSLLDLGSFRVPFGGNFTLDGTDMEWNGAVPDIPVEEDLNAEAAGRDVQLEVAIKTLAEEVEKEAKENPPVKLRYARP